MWYWAISRVPEEERDQFKAEMAQPLEKMAARRAPTRREIEEENQDFAAFYASVSA